jgi:hypothetical protein
MFRMIQTEHVEWEQSIHSSLLDDDLTPFEVVSSMHSTGIRDSFRSGVKDA